jgi:hypothetical protein
MTVYTKYRRWNAGNEEDDSMEENVKRGWKLTKKE